MNSVKFSRMIRPLFKSQYTKIFCGLLFVFVVLSVSLALSQTNNNDDTIILIHTFFRHGERTPDVWSTYPTDPHKNVTYEPFGRGQLTKNGKQTMLEVGKTLREQYEDFINDNFDLNSVFAKTTNFKRTKMSLQSVLAALFPPKQEDMLEPGLYWQPVAFSYDSGHNEIADPFYFCLYYLHAYYDYLFSDEAQSIISRSKVLYEELGNITGLNLRVPKDVCSLYGTLKAQEDFGLEPPAWISEYYPDKMLEQCYLHHHMMSARPKLKRLSTGFLVKKIIDDTKSHIKSPRMKKSWYLYSLHDINLVFLMKSLGIYYPHLPPCGATLSIEVHYEKNSKEYSMRVVYKEKPSENEKVLCLPNCSELCPWSKFLDLVADLLPGQYDTCLNTNEI